MSEATFHRRRNRYGGMRPDSTKRLRGLEGENARLRKTVAEQAVGMSIPKEMSRGKPLSPAGRRVAVRQVCGELAVPERRACGAIGQPRSTQPDGDTRLNRVRPSTRRRAKAPQDLAPGFRADKTGYDPYKRAECSVW